MNQWCIGSVWLCILLWARPKLISRAVCGTVQDVVLADDVKIEEIARQLDGYSGDDITNICRDAAMNGMRRVMSGMRPHELMAVKEQGRVSGMRQYCIPVIVLQLWMGVS